MTKKSWIVISLIVAAAIAATLITAFPAEAGKLEEAIAKTPQGVGKGMIDPKAAPGFMGIPGAPTPFWFYGILWGIWVGWIFSTVGAFGGIMAGVGHITVFGLADYGRMFKDTSPVLNKLLTDSIRTSNSVSCRTIRFHILAHLLSHGTTRLAAGPLPGWRRSSRRVSYSCSHCRERLTSAVHRVLRDHRAGDRLLPLLRDDRTRNEKPRKLRRRPRLAFEKEHIKRAAGETTEHATAGVHVTHWGASKISFTFYGVEFSFSPIVPILGGFVIAAISAFIGVGGGFLYVPFLTSIAGLPMYIVAGTSAMAVLVVMITSIFTFMFIKGTPIDFLFIGVELVGIFIGSIVGPYTSKYIPDIWLKRIFVVLAVYVGVGYTTKGFLGHSIFPGM